MKKVLFTATVDSHIKSFHLPYLKYFKDIGYEVHVATNSGGPLPYCDIKHAVPFERKPIKLGNVKSIGQLKKIIDAEHYDIVHTHTPMGAAITRIATAKARKKFGTRVIYTAHGFHFFKGARIQNWIMFYPVEKILAYFTDTIITINQEDYEIAKNRFKSDVQYVAGVGIDPAKFNFKMIKADKTALRKSIGLTDADFVVIFPAELSNRKRQIWLIDALKDVISMQQNIHLLLPGADSLNGKVQNFINELGLQKNIHTLGFRCDIPELLMISNLAVSSSSQEGLPVNIMEAMYVGLPLIVTDCRGNRDLVTNGLNGYVISNNDKNDIAQKLSALYLNQDLRISMGITSQGVVNNYLLDKIIDDMTKIYQSHSDLVSETTKNQMIGIVS